MHQLQQTFLLFLKTNWKTDSSEKKTKKQTNVENPKLLQKRINKLFKILKPLLAVGAAVGVYFSF